MLEGKAVIGETDMLQTMQQDALDLAAKALDFFDVTEATEIARFIKKVKCYIFCLIKICDNSMYYVMKMKILA